MIISELIQKIWIQEQLIQLENQQENWIETSTHLHIERAVLRLAIERKINIMIIQSH